MRKTALPTGLVDIKVCVIDQTWSGLKFVIPKAQRTKRQKGSSIAPFPGSGGETVQLRVVLAGAGEEELRLS